MEISKHKLIEISNFFLKIDIQNQMILFLLIGSILTLNDFYKKKGNILSNSKDIGDKDKQIRQDIIMNTTYSDNRIVTVNSSAGGGKTTLILERVKQNSKNKYLILVFNKSMEKDITPLNI
jgi:hypothetical protein